MMSAATFRSCFVTPAARVLNADAGFAAVNQMVRLVERVRRDNAIQSDDQPEAAVPVPLHRGDLVRRWHGSHGSPGTPEIGTYGRY